MYMFCNKLVVDYIVEFLLLKSQIDEIIYFVSRELNFSFPSL